jgi:transposase
MGSVHHLRLRRPPRPDRPTGEGRKQARGDLSDAHWTLIEGLFPEQRRGGTWNDHRLTFDGIFWILRTGAPWRDLPERYGKWPSVHHRFNRYRKSGVFDRILKAPRIRLDKDGLIDWDLWCVDGSNVRASRSAAGALKKAKNRAESAEITRWGVAAADGDPSSTSSWTLEVSPLPRSSPPAKRTSRNTSSS